MTFIAGIEFREATTADVAAMTQCRLEDPTLYPADPRMAAYFDGRHHPQQALLPRVGYVALAENQVMGYIAGHLTTRHGCGGEVQYLFVAPAFAGVGLELGCYGCSQSGLKNKVCRKSASPSPVIARRKPGHSTRALAQNHSGNIGTRGKISASSPAMN